jgi:Na+/H+ antiporter NhaD/arsenite permease-like protein
MLSQILALIIAIVLFSALLQGKYPRYLLTLAAGGAMVLVVLLGTMGSPAAALEALSVDSFVKPQFWFAHGGVTEFNVGINWSTILFLAGMMIMVEAMSEAGFFDWVCLRLAKALGFRPMPLMLRRPAPDTAPPSPCPPDYIPRPAWHCQRPRPNT